jgi:hypothetical protein
VSSSRIRAGVRAGLIAAAATAGVIIGFGVRHNDWAGPFQSLGVQVLQGLGVSSPTLGLATVIGFTAHAAWMIVWGIAFVVLAHRKPSVLAMLLAILVGALASVAARSMIPAAMGAMRFATLPAIQAVLCVAMMIAGLMAGRALSRAD